MRVALVGPTQSGKSSLLAAVAQAGGSHLDLHRPDQPHLAVVKVPDERLVWLTEHYKPRKSTPAEMELLDVPGVDLSDDPGRTHAKTHWPALRTSDLLLFVVRSFTDDSVAPYRGRIDPQADLRELLAEMNFADLEQATARIERLQAALHKGGAKDKDQAKELELMQRLRQALEQERPLAQAVTSAEEAKLLRSFAFLSSKPALVVLNCSEQEAAAEVPAEFCGLPCLRLSAKIEAELSQLPLQERGEFMADLGLKVPGDGPAAPRRASGGWSCVTFSDGGGGGVPRLDGPGRHRRGHRGRDDPQRYRPRLHPGRDGRLRGPARRRRHEGRPARPARSAWRARATSSRTAT